MPEGYVELRTPRAVGWLRADLAAGGLEPLWANVTPLPGAKGRGGVGTLALPDGRIAVVRPYRRGGAFGRLLGDRYPGPARVRRELELLAALRAEGVPVVTPLAAVARRRGAFWQLRLCTELEADALPLPAFLSAFPALRRWAVEAAGVVVRLSFARGLHHPDLHADNVLCSARGDKVRAVLIDLDRAWLRLPVSPRQQQAMLVRMARHLHRHQKRLPTRITCSERLRFLRALGLDRTQRREQWWQLARRLAAQLLRRRFLLRG